jgi:uncharacterized protein (DUF2225 family)
MRELDFYSYQNMIAPYIDHLEYTIDQVSKLSGLLFTLYGNVDDKGNITSFSDFNKEALTKLINASKSLSSYADKFQNKINELSKVLSKEL